MNVGSPSPPASRAPLPEGGARSCARDGAPAIAVCTSCGVDICAVCHRATLTGYALCPDCGVKLLEVFRTPWESAKGFAQHVHAFGLTSVAVLSSARAFYGSVPPYGPMLKPGFFAVIAYTIGAYAAFLWQWAFVDAFPEFVTETAKQTGMAPETAFQTLLVALPLAAPVVILLHTALLHASLRLFGAPTRWRLTVRIVAYASAAWLFQLVPPVAEFPIGYMLAIVWLVNIEMIAVRHYFELGVWRSMAVVFVPFVAMTVLGLA